MNTPPDAGVVRELVTCGERVPQDGDGVTADTWLASSTLRAIVRHPVASRTLPGVGGGTLVDVAPWDHPDVAYEWVPLVDGGWLDVTSIDDEPDGVVVTGTVRALPGQFAQEGATASVRWRLDPEQPVVHVEGADALWLHPLPHTRRLGPALFRDGVQVVTNASAERDLGGAIIFEDVSHIAVSPIGSDAWLDHPTHTVNATFDGATEVRLGTADETVAVPVSEPIRWTLPTVIDRIRGEAPGRAASEWHNIDDTAISDAVGDAGTVWVSTGTTTLPHSVRWTHEDGRHGRALTSDGLAILQTGAGRVALTVANGPAFTSRHAELDVPAGVSQSIRLVPAPKFDASGMVPVEWLTPGERDRTQRQSDADQLLDAAHRGSPVTVLAPQDDVADADVDAVIRVRNGAQLTSADGWSVAAWPWSAHPRRAGHGASAVQGRSPEDGLALAAQGPTLGRLTLVDAEWLRQADPQLADPAPTGVLLTSPSDLKVYYRWLDAGVRLVPAGPITWLPVPAPEAVLAVEAERAWLAGQGTASTDGHLVFSVDGKLPGQVVPRAPNRQASITLHASDVFDRVCLVIDGEARSCFAASNGSTYITSIPDDASWAVAVATSETDVAVTAPMWFGFGFE